MVPSSFVMNHFSSYIRYTIPHLDIYIDKMAKRGAERDLNKDNAEEEEEEEIEDVRPLHLSTRIGMKLMSVARTERYTSCSYYWTAVSLLGLLIIWEADDRIRGMPKRKGLGGAAPAPQAVSGIFH
jgi:hypothetical protein